VRRLARAAELIGMPVVTLDTATIVGEVRDVLFDPRQTSFVGITLRGRGLLSPPFIGLLPVAALRAIGHDAVMIESASSVVREDSDISAITGEQRDIVGSEVVTDEGTVLGDISDIVLEINESTPAVVGYCVIQPDGHELIVPAPEGPREWAEVVVVPSNVEQRGAIGLIDFREVLERMRSANSGMGL
jgi:uncharacterized protein YrrD